MLVFLDDTKDKIYRHALEEYPFECCGILVGKREERGRIVHKIIPERNVSDIDKKRIHFMINPLEIVKVEQDIEKEGLEIIGFYHSHPNCKEEASNEDMIHMISGYSYPIVSVEKEKCIAMSSYVKDTQRIVQVYKEEIMKEKSEEEK